jgi:hypothetical protein
MKKIITIFILPHEIDLYKDLISRINNDIVKYDLKDFWIDSTLCVSEKMVNWEDSQVNKEEIIEEFNKINQNINGDFSINHDGQIQGCVDKRRESSPIKYPDAVSFTWIDADILFPEGTFYIIDESVNNLKDSNFILTPQYVKMWDSTWDILVHPKYNSFGYDYMKTSEYNPDNSFGIYGDICLRPIPDGMFKFGGGAITTFSSNLLNSFSIPNSFGPYGEEDTFIMTCCSYFWKKLNIKQYIIENLVYSQKNRDHIDRRKDILIYDRRVEYRQISLDNFSNEINKIIYK